jgi:hypothetical protein
MVTGRGYFSVGERGHQWHSTHGQVHRAGPRSVQGFLAMIQERVRARPETGFLAHKTSWVASDGLATGKRISMRLSRLLEGPVCARSLGLAPEP